MDIPYEQYEELFNLLFSDERNSERCHELLSKHKGVSEKTMDANYVWLPLRFVEPSKEHPNGMVYIDWYDEWKWEDWE